MVEIITLIVAFFALVNGSTETAATFVAIAAAAASWRAYQSSKKLDKVERELQDLRSEMRHSSTLAERALQIAAVTANTLGAQPQAASPISQAARPAEKTPDAPAPAVPGVQKPVEAPPPVPFKDATSFTADRAASTRISPPIAPETPPPPVVRHTNPPSPTAPPAPVRAPKMDAPHIPVPPARAPRKSAGERLRSTLALEEILGTNWLNKLGVISLVLGVAGFGIYELGQLGAYGKIAMCIAVALTLLVGGIFLERKERYQILGRTAIGGGWALLFFASYALDHVPAMRVMHSDVLDSVVMLIVAGVMVAHTLRYRSQLVTGLAFLLAYSTVALSHDTVYSLAAGAILTAAIVLTVVKLNWYELEVFAIVSSYGNHFYWLYRLLGDDGAQGHPFSQFTASTALLLFYWAAFRVSYVIRTIRTRSEENISTAAGLLNTVALLLVMKFQAAHPEFAFHALLALGAIEFMIAQLRITKRRRPAFLLLTLLGTALMLAAVPFRYAGENVSILWMIGAEVLLFAGVFTDERLFRRLGLGTGLLVLGDILLVEVPRMTAGHGIQTASPLAPYSILLFVMAAVFYANNTLLRLHWPKLFTDPLDDNLLTATSYPGAITLGFACWAGFTGDALGVALACSMLAVAALGFVIQSKHLQAQSFGIGLFAAARSLLFNPHWGSAPHSWHRFLSLATASTLFYVTAKVSQHRDEPEQQVMRGTFAVCATALAVALLFTEVPSAWQPLAFAVFAWALAEAAAATRYFALRWHTHAVAGIALFAAASFDVVATPWWRVLHMGMWKVLPVVAVFYVLSSRAARLHSRSRIWVRELYSWSASFLALWFIYEGIESHYVAAAWVLYAVALSVISRAVEWTSLARQALVLGAMSAAEVAIVNLLGSTPGAHDSVRTWVTLIVIASLYGMSEGLRLPEDWQRKGARALHSWLATALAASLAWYELSTPSVAVGWAMLGAALYEYGAFRKSAQLRWQAYVILAASFVRIFFANLTAGAAGGWLSTRNLTVLPIVAIYFFVYSREVGSQRTARFQPAQLFAHLGTAALLALFYFQFAGEWVITAWACVVMALLAIALWLGQSIFVQQCIVIAVAVLARGMFHNLFGGSYFSGSDWQGRFGVTGSAILLLFASLPLAFEYRKRSSVESGITGLAQIVAILTHRVEQPLFFVPVALLTTMLALKMDHGMVTLAWGVEAVLIFVAALLVKERSYRLTGMLLLLLCVAKIVAVDVWRLERRDMYLTFMGLGASLLLVSFLYSKYRETIRQYL